MPGQRLGRLAVEHPRPAAERRLAFRIVEPRVAASQVIAPGDYFGGIWDTNRVGTALYGVPWYVDTRLLFYRRDLLAQAGYNAPPRSWASPTMPAR